MIELPKELVDVIWFSPGDQAELAFERRVTEEAMTSGARLDKG